MKILTIIFVLILQNSSASTRSAEDDKFYVEEIKDENPEENPRISLKHSVQKDLEHHPYDLLYQQQEPSSKNDEWYDDYAYVEDNDDDYFYVDEEDDYDYDGDYEFSNKEIPFNEALNESYEKREFDDINRIAGHDIPRSRVKRRIIAVSKAIERSRSGRRGNTYSQSRGGGSSGPDSPYNNKRNLFQSRHGPTGTDALFRLYPEIAPPEWRRRHGIKLEIENFPNDEEINVHEKEKTTIQPKIKNYERKITKTTPALKIKKQNDTKTEITKFQRRRKLRRPKIKLPRSTKEAIAKFAQKNGIEQTIQHFKRNSKIILRPATVKRYISRLRNRMIRLANRSLKN